MKRKEMTLKRRILASPAHDGELQKDEWIPAFAGMTAEEAALTAKWELATYLDEARHADHGAGTS